MRPGVTGSARNSPSLRVTQASVLPAGREERVAWLYDRWEELDGWIDEQLVRRRPT